MTDCHLDELHQRIVDGEQLTEELWVLRQTDLGNDLATTTAEAISDVWNLAFHHDGIFPKLEAAKALVETALAADTSYPVLTNDGLVYDALLPSERLELVRFIRERLDQSGAPVARRILKNFVHDLLEGGPTV